MKLKPAEKDNYEGTIDQMIDLFNEFRSLTMLSPRWLDSSVGRALHRYGRVHGSEFFFSGFNFITA